MDSLCIEYARSTVRFSGFFKLMLMLGFFLLKCFRFCRSCARFCEAVQDQRQDGQSSFRAEAWEEHADVQYG